MSGQESRDQSLDWYKAEVDRLQKLCNQLQQDNVLKDAEIYALKAAAANKLSEQAVESIEAFQGRRAEALDRHRREYENVHGVMESAMESDVNILQANGEGFDEIDS